jgi:hypothetical protein
MQRLSWCDIPRSEELRHSRSEYSSQPPAHPPYSLLCLIVQAAESDHRLDFFDFLTPVLAASDFEVFIEMMRSVAAPPLDPD